MATSKQSPAASPRRTDVRMLVSFPSVLILLVLGQGITFYLLAVQLVESVERNQPNFDSSQFFSDFIWLLLAFVLLASLASAGLLYTVQRPLRKIAEAVDSMARGNIRPLVDTRGSSFEIDQLGKTFNSMVDFVNSMIEQREAYFSENMQAGSMVINLEGRVTSINQTGLHLLDAEQKELTGRNLRDIREKSPKMAGPFFEWCLQQIERPENFTPREAEVRVRENLDLSVASTLMHDAANQPTAILIHFQDAAEKRMLQNLFARTDQLAALGSFMHGLSNEMRNPLTALKGTTQLLIERLEESEACEPYMRRIVHEVDRLDRLIREIYEFSRAPVRESAPADLAALARKSLNRAEQILPQEQRQDKKLQMDLAEGLPAVCCQEDRMVQAISNVIINAFEQMPKGAELTIRTGKCPEDNLPARNSANEPLEHPALILDVQNTGSRVPEELVRQIFEPFVSTKPGASGLGLAIAYQIVSQNRGKLLLKSDDSSTRFRFVFRILELTGENVSTA